jgi:hydrogenase maturation protein HypF
MIHRQFYLKGIIQGVGFRPFVYRLATELDLKGWVQNSSEGVTIAVEGEPEKIADFEQRLLIEKPSLSSFEIIERLEKPLDYLNDFEILASAEGQTKRALVLPDLATCSACLSDIFDPNNRRYYYPFTNCTYCGPRHSILLDLPYDRSHTSMKHFQMCRECQQEYEDPRDRRFHAQPNACPQCGPHLTFCLSPRFFSGSSNSDPLQLALEAILSGQILAIKGIGGFHLVCDATHEQAVQTLRDRKHRPHKPFAIMVKDVGMAQAYCRLTSTEADLLSAPQAPIVILPQIQSPNIRSQIAPNIAPDNPYLGVMLPYSPLHHLLLQTLSIPIVATSGNRSDEPICIDNQEALDRLGNIADAFLLHDRPIVRPLDDSIVRVIDGKMMMLRRSRGYAPLPLPIPTSSPAPTILAVGGHLKNTIALTRDDQVLISPHIGDLDSVETLHRFETTIAQSLQLYDLTPQGIVRDAHPDYASSQCAETWAQTCSPPPAIVSLQHHHAHLLACWGEHPVLEPALGVIWDGTGYGTDGQIWGGEFFELMPPREGRGMEIRRVAHLRPFPLLGGDRSAREPRRSALGLLWAAFGEEIWNWTHLAPIQSCTPEERKIFQKMLQNQLNVPLTSSLGRLFDGVASLLGLFQQISFEGQAAQALEYLIFSLDLSGLDTSHHELNPMPLQPSIGSEDLDWQPLLEQILSDLAQGKSLREIALFFHQSLISTIVLMAQKLGHTHVLLSGGCFQNVQLLHNTIIQLRQHQLIPHWPQQVPPNDGGIAFGQAIGAALNFTNPESSTLFL